MTEFGQPDPGQIEAAAQAAPAAPTAPSTPAAPTAPSTPAATVPGPAGADEPWITRAELAAAGKLIGVLVVVGALLGVVWKSWSHTATLGAVIAKGSLVPDETEGFISSDGRFAVVTVIAGLLAGVIAWRWRSRRGPVLAAGLAIGAVLGALATDLVGAVIGGGKDSGPVGTVFTRLPLRVHATGLLVVEALAAIVVYVLCALFAQADDLSVAPASPVDDQVAALG